jgi:hypothetical protein
VGRVIDLLGQSLGRSAERHGELHPASLGGDNGAGIAHRGGRHALVERRGWVELPELSDFDDPFTLKLKVIWTLGRARRVAGHYLMECILFIGAGYARQAYIPEAAGRSKPHVAESNSPR